MIHLEQWHRVAVIAALLSLMCSVTVSAFDFSANNIYYNINDKTLTAEVTFGNGYNSYSGQVTIPATVSNSGKTYDVTAVGENAFRDCAGLTGVVFGANVSTIGRRAFLNCSALTAVTITEGMTEIGDYAFAQCEALSTVTMNNDSPVLVGNGAFVRCTSLHNVKWSSCERLEGHGGIYSLGSSAFAHCTSLTSIVLPGNIEHMGTSIFDGCTQLSSITVTATHPLPLSGDPFALDSSTTVHVPSTGQAGETATLYQNAVGWRGYNIAELPYSFIDHNGYTYLKTSASTVALNGSQQATTSVVVRNNITGYSGENYNVTSISDNAFKDKNITSLNTGNALKLNAIGTESFAGCTSLTTITLIEGITTLGERAFAGCTQLTTVQVPSTVRIISKGAFENCSSLKNVNLVMGVSTISENAFAHCTSLNSLSLPRSITCVEPNALKGSSALTEILVDPNCPYYTSIEGVLYEMKYGYGFDPEQADELSKLAIYPPNKTDEALYIPPGVTEIKTGAVVNATHLKRVAIPATTTVFSDKCFDGTSLQFINYRSSTATTDDTSGITSQLKAGATLQVPMGTATIYQGLPAWQGFKDIVECYDVYCDNQFAYDWNDLNQVTLVGILPAAVDASGTATIPSGMTLNSRFYWITELKNTATTQVTGLVKTLKMSCDSLAVIDISDDINPLAALTSLQTISLTGNNPHFTIIDNVLYNKRGNHLYYYPTTKTQHTFILPSAVDTIMPQAFARNPHLKVLNASRSLGYISNKTFEGCTALHTVDNIVSVGTIGQRAFAQCSALTKITGGENLTLIGDEAFVGCSNLKQFPFVHGMLTTMGRHAFKGCSSLTVVVLSNMLNSIGDGAFEDCTALNKVFFTNDIKNFGQQVFKGCTSLSQMWLCNAEPPQVDNDFFETTTHPAIFVPHDAENSYRNTAPWSSASQVNTSQYLYDGVDVNNDKSVNAYDITMVMSAMLGDIAGDIVGHCDVNRDGAITAADITIIYDYILSDVNALTPYRFLNKKNLGVDQYISLADGPQMIKVLNQNTNSYLTSGLTGLSDNPLIANVTTVTSQGILYLKIVPNEPGYFTMMAIVSDGTTCHYCAFPIIVQE